MARNQEKSQSVLNRLLAAAKDGPEEKRPYMASEEFDLQKCEKWRRQIIGEITRYINSIQNAGLGEHKIRDLNDLINKTIREKKHWERQIKKLGGPDYMRGPIKVEDNDGNKPFEVDGYFYFGAARDLKGVRELLDTTSSNQKNKKSKSEMIKLVDAEYYGYDHNETLLEAEETIIRTQLRKQREEEFTERRKRYCMENGINERTEEEKDKNNIFHSYVALPSKIDIEQQVLKRRKQLVIEKYGLDK